MQMEVEFLILPFASQDGRSLLHVLVTEFRSKRWTRFDGAVGFAKASGNFPDLLEAMREFAAEPASEVCITFGADVFGTATKGSDYDALEGVLSALRGGLRAEVHLYHEVGRTFHPKMYLFSNVPEQRALLILGSSNWSEGGLVNNVEANVLLRFDLASPQHLEAYHSLRNIIDTYWRESQDE